MGQFLGACMRHQSEEGRKVDGREDNDILVTERLTPSLTPPAIEQELCSIYTTGLRSNEELNVNIDIHSAAEQNFTASVEGDSSESSHKTSSTSTRRAIPSSSSAPTLNQYEPFIYRFTSLLWRPLTVTIQRPNSKVLIIGSGRSAFPIHRVTSSPQLKTPSLRRNTNATTSSAIWTVTRGKSLQCIHLHPQYLIARSDSWPDLRVIPDR
ncbi:uncharacterized protein LOC124159800 [Ischnura elegans]|uniref:uncharacterized protein LOC124159800 n=1 Tax=Ischnura elegans TaxID=197161 RepID=UPI001ED86B9B|nr:uncharacterized protein LOC124159800 [Ischnura elegans]